MSWGRAKSFLLKTKKKIQDSGTRIGEVELAKGEVIKGRLKNPRAISRVLEMTKGVLQVKAMCYIMYFLPLLLICSLVPRVHFHLEELQEILNLA